MKRNLARAVMAATMAGTVTLVTPTIVESAALADTTSTSAAREDDSTSDKEQDYPTLSVENLSAFLTTPDGIYYAPGGKPNGSDGSQQTFERIKPSSGNPGINDNNKALVVNWNKLYAQMLLSVERAFKKVNITIEWNRSPAAHWSSVDLDNPDSLPSSKGIVNGYNDLMESGADLDAKVVKSVSALNTKIKKDTGVNALETANALTHRRQGDGKEFTATQHKGDDGKSTITVHTHDSIVVPSALLGAMVYTYNKNNNNPDMSRILTSEMQKAARVSVENDQRLWQRFLDIAPNHVRSA